MPRVTSSFIVHGTFNLSGREEVFVYGELSGGKTSPGDVATVTSVKPSLQATISTIEIVDGTPSGSHLALGLQIQDTDRDRWIHLPERSAIEI